MCVLAAQKNRLIEMVLLNETVLLSTHNICFGVHVQIRKLNFQDVI